MVEEKIAEVNVELRPKNKSGKLPWIIISALLMVILGGGLFVYNTYLTPLNKGLEAGSKHDEEKDTGKTREKYSYSGLSFPLEYFIVNLANVDEPRYIKVNIELEIENNKVADEIKQKLPLVKDAVITTLSSKRVEDIRSTVGKHQLKQELISKINATLTSGKTKNVFFTEFVVQ